TIPFTVNGVTRDEKTGKTVLGATGKTTVNRRDYGVNFARPDNPAFLGDNVEIELNLITRAASPQ
ncbi:MAG: YceI family protein, partial [Pyrinomonadaceae bacterium]